MPSAASQKLRFGLPEWTALLLCVLLLLSLVPICAVARYAHPSSDDFGYSAGTKAAMENGDFIQVLKEAANKAVKSYSSWQGSYAATFLFALQPAIYSDTSYGLTTYLMLAALLFSTLFFSKTLVVDCLGSKRSYALILFAACMLVTVQFMPDKCEAFFWYNGACYYTLFYSFSLLFFSCVFKLLKTSTLSGLWTVLSLLLALLIGGGNYSTGLLCCEGMVLLCVWAFWKKHPKKIVLLVIALVLLTAFAFSALAPGNRVRAAKSSGMSPFKAVILSLLYGAYKLLTWTNLPQLALAVCAFPVLFAVARQSGFAPKHPFLLLLVAYALFSSQMTPALYGMSTLGGGRQIDIYYDSYYLFLMFALFLLCCRLNQKGLLKDFPEKSLSACPKRVLALAAAVCLLLGSACANYGFTNLTSVDTALSLLQGSAQKYDEEYRAVEQSIRENPEAVVSEVETCPDFFYRFGMEFGWVRKDMSKYYGVKSITLREAE